MKAYPFLKRLGFISLLSTPNLCSSFSNAFKFIIIDLMPLSTNSSICLISELVSIS